MEEVRVKTEELESRPTTTSDEDSGKVDAESQARISQLEATVQESEQVATQLRTQVEDQAKANAETNMTVTLTVHCDSAMTVR